MADIDEIVTRFERTPGVAYGYLALNQQGRDRAAAYAHLSPSPLPPMLVCHLCDTFVRRNANQGQADEIERWARIADAAASAGIAEAGIGLNAAWGSNFEGPFSLEERMAMLRRAHELWDERNIRVTWLLLGDPMSWCLPSEVEDTLGHVLALWPDITNVYLHLHDARGMALPSIYAALRCLGDRDLYLDTTAGGIGGCPYCGNGRATGMAATEDVVAMLEGMGIDTGVDLDALIDAVWLLEDIIGRPVPGHVAHAGPRPTRDQVYDPNLPLVETHQDARHYRLGEKAITAPHRPWRAPIPTPATTARSAAGAP